VVGSAASDQWQRAAGRKPTRGEDRQVGVEPIGETPVERDDESVEGGKNERAFYGRIIARAKRVRERAAQSLRLSRSVRKKQEGRADAAQRRREFSGGTD
jgi:hypothetical protein